MHVHGFDGCMDAWNWSYKWSCQLSVDPGPALAENVDNVDPGPDEMTMTMIRI